MIKRIQLLISSILILIVSVSISATLPASDNFNRADGGLGANWSVATGSDPWSLTGNQVSPPAGVVFGITYWNADSFGNDQFSQATLENYLSTHQIGPAVRIQTATGNHYGCVVNATSGYEIIRGTLGTYTDIGGGTLGSTPTNGDVIKCSITGTTITMSINGSSIGTASDATYASGVPGLTGYLGSALDNWSADNNGGGATPKGAPLLGFPGQ